MENKEFFVTIGDKSKFKLHFNYKLNPLDGYILLISSENIETKDIYIQCYKNIVNGLNIKSIYELFYNYFIENNKNYKIFSYNELLNQKFDLNITIINEIEELNRTLTFVLRYKNRDNHIKLKIMIEDLQNEYNELKVNFEDLQYEYNELKVNFEDLQYEYNELKVNFEEKLDILQIKYDRAINNLNKRIYTDSYYIDTINQLKYQINDYEKKNSLLEENNNLLKMLLKKETNFTESLGSIENLTKFQDPIDNFIFYSDDYFPDSIYNRTNTIGLSIENLTKYQNPIDNLTKNIENPIDNLTKNIENLKYEFREYKDNNSNKIKFKKFLN